MNRFCRAPTAAELKKARLRNFLLSWQSAMALALADIGAVYKRASEADIRSLIAHAR